MRARCSICQETLDDALAPLTTTCGHLYCAECATRHFAHSVDLCAICRAGPYEFDDLVRLYPDYVRTPPPTRTPTPEPSSPSCSHARLRARGKRPAARKAGLDAIDACYDVLEDRAVLDSPALEAALDRTNELIAALEEMGAPDIRTILSHLTALLGDIRKRATDERVAADAEFAKLIARVDELQYELEDTRGY